MNGRIKMPLRLAAVTATAAVVCGMSAFPAAAADDDVQVVNTETVQVYTDASGKIATKRLYEQVALTGTGTVDLRNPVGTNGLRNLDGFGGFDVKDGVQTANLSVDGEKQLRTVSDYDGDLPLEVKVSYTLDGEPVEPGDVVGESGKLEVRYTVKNVTAVQQEVTFDDGKGGTVSRNVEVPIPMVGSLTTVAPSSFTNVASSEANMAGDGKGGTKLTFTMTLFPPLGSDTVEFGYSADITDGVIPRASISALPVNPLESPSFKAAGESYEGGATTGIELTDGASQIDENLLKLRDGAADLLAGLIQLRDGARQLNAGLAGEAAPGADKLAAGSAELAGGIGQIDDGAQKLASGTGQLADGLAQAGDKAPALVGGLQQVQDGLSRVDHGLRQLSGGISAVRKNPEYKRLLHGLTDLVDGVGSTAKEGSLTWGVDKVRQGLASEAVPGINKMQAGVHNEPSAENPEPGAYEKLGCAIVVLNDVKSGTLANGRYGTTDPCYRDPDSNPGGAIPPLLPLATISGDADTPQEFQTAVVTKLISQLTDGRSKLYSPGNSLDDETLYGGLSLLLEGLTRQSKADPGAIPALSVIECALDNSSLGTTTCNALRPNELGARQGLELVAEGVPTLVDTIIGNVQGAIGNGADVPEDETLRGGMNGLQGGVGQIQDGGTALLEGLAKLSDGAGQLDDGAGELANGTGKAADGANQLSDGANQLATGLGEAASGSGRLADGLGEAAAGAPKLRDGAQRLSDEGTSKLVDAGQATAQNYGEMYAVIEAGAERADAEKMVYGAPEGAIGLAAYSYEIKGEDGEGGRNAARGLGGLAVLAAGVGAFALRRRVI